MIHSAFHSGKVHYQLYNAETNSIVQLNITASVSEFGSNIFTGFGGKWQGNGGRNRTNIKNLLKEDNVKHLKPLL